jgi:hypothetical protein
MNPELPTAGSDLQPAAGALDWHHLVERGISTMSTRPFDDPEHNEREEHIEDLKRRADELTGGEMIAGEAAESPPEVREQFWEHAVAW